MDTKASTSPMECAMAGDAPAASNVFAMMSMLTKLVMHCTRGEAALQAATAA
jgi:hypothetical protein